MKIEYAVIYLDTNSKEAEDTLNSFAAAGWEVVCSHATNKVVLVRKTQDIEVFVDNEESDREQIIKFYWGELEKCKAFDKEQGHIYADELLMRLLTVLGYGEISKKFQTLEKRYS